MTHSTSSCTVSTSPAVATHTAPQVSKYPGPASSDDLLLDECDEIIAAAYELASHRDNIPDLAGSIAAPERYFDPTLLFDEPTPTTLADAVLEACNGNTRLAAALRRIGNLESEHKRLREELKAAQAGQKIDVRIYPYLELGEKNTHVRQYTHNHAREVISGLPPGVAAVWSVLLVSTVWGGYVESSADVLMSACRLKRSAYYERLRVLQERALIVKHPRGWMLNPALVECCPTDERYQRGQEFAAYFSVFDGKRVRTKRNGEHRVDDSFAVAGVLAGPATEEVIGLFADGGLSAHVYPLTAKRAKQIIDETHNSMRKRSAKADKKQRAVRVLGTLRPRHQR